MYEKFFSIKDVVLLRIESEFQVKYNKFINGNICRRIKIFYATPFMLTLIINIREKRSFVKKFDDKHLLPESKTK